MKKTVTVCDRCGKDVESRHHPFFLQTGWQPDAAGGPSEPTGEEFDWCNDCARYCLRSILELPEFGYQLAERLILHMKKQ
jgi:hypothetical protein